MTARSALKETMRRFLLLLTSRAMMALVVTLAAPPQRLEVAYEVSRSGFVIADIVERLEHGGGKYELSETMKGRGLLALRGSIRRSSRGSGDASGLRPVEFIDERTGRQTARAWFDWQANTLTMQFREGPEVQPLPANAQDRLSFLL